MKKIVIKARESKIPRDELLELNAKAAHDYFTKRAEYSSEALGLDPSESKEYWVKDIIDHLENRIAKGHWGFHMGGVTFDKNLFAHEDYDEPSPGYFKENYRDGEFSRAF